MVIRQNKTFDDPLTILATQRCVNLFAADVSAQRTNIEEAICGRRILVIGGAGSIGSSTVHEIISFRPKTLHVVDINENNLAELVRDLRSGSKEFNVPDFRTLPVDFGSTIMHKFLMEQDSYDFVLNFAAIKHVRSEKDVYSILQMLDTNILKPTRLLKWLAKRGGTKGYFCVSTDKAANPVNLMGASKRLMEHIIFYDVFKTKCQSRVTSARFANVAFSDGSLLYSWVKRLEKRQPLAVPRNTRRFFISLQEAGKMCLLAAVCAPDRHLLVPRLAPAADLQDLQSIAVRFLKYHGYEPHYYENETEAKGGIESDVADGRYPLLLTPLDTSGEKPCEEFVSEEEQMVEVGMSSLLGVAYVSCKKTALLQFLEDAQGWIDNPSRPVSKEAIVSSIAKVIPEFSHIASEKTLDGRM